MDTITGVSSGVVVDTAVKRVDVNTNNEVEKKTQNIESQTDTETQDAVPQPSDGIVGSRVNVSV